MREFYTHQASTIHRTDARVKLLFTLALIGFLNLTPTGAWPAYVLFLAVVLSLAILSRLGAGFVLKRALIAAPFVLAAVPLIFSGPPPLEQVRLLPGIGVSYSPEGLERFAIIAIKSWLSVQAAILLAATTRFPDLAVALQELKVPKIFVAIISLMWRYLFVIGAEAGRMLRARASRSASAVDPRRTRLRRTRMRRTGGSLTWRARVTGGMAGSLFLRAIERSDRVFAAMLARGYTGELAPGETSSLTPRDRRVLVASLALLAGLWIVGILTTPS